MDIKIIENITKYYDLGYAAGIRNSGVNPHFLNSDRWKSWNVGFRRGKQNSKGHQRRKSDRLENVIEIEGV